MDTSISWDNGPAHLECPSPTWPANALNVDWRGGRGPTCTGLLWLPCVYLLDRSQLLFNDLYCRAKKRNVCAKTNRDPWVLMFIVGTWFCCTKVREIKLAQYLDVCVRAYVFLRILKSGQYARDLLLAVKTWIGWFRFTCWSYSWSYLDHMGESSSLLMRK